MGRINLKQNSGVRTTDHAAPVTNSHSDMRLQGISAMQRASNSLANGIAYVGQAMGDIAKDRLQMENEIAVNGAQIEVLKSEQALNDEFERRITSGEFNDFNSFQDAYIKEYSGKIESPLNKKFQDDGMSEAARHAMATYLKRSQANNFARLGGAWKRITTDNMVKGVFNQAEEWVNMGGDVKSLPKFFSSLVDNGYMSPETAQKSIADFTKMADNKALQNYQMSVRAAETPEEIDNLIARFSQSDTYKKLGKFDRENFDIFSAVARRDAKLRIAQAKTLSAKTKKAEDEKAVSAANADLDLKSRSNIEIAEISEDLTRLAVNKEENIKNFENLLANSSLSEDEKKVKLRDFLAHLDDVEIKQNKAIKAKIKQTAVNALDAAMKNEGFVSSDILKDDKLAKERKEKFLRGRLEDMTPEQKAEYSGRFFEIIKRANRYDFESDDTGEELVSLMRQAQLFTAERRKQAMQFILDKVKGVKPDTWTSADKKKFGEEFDKIMKLSGNWNAWWGDGESDPVMALDMYDRVLKLASIRKLSLTEALNELKEDPYYKTVFQKVNRQKALEFINGR